MSEENEAETPEPEIIMPVTQAELATMQQTIPTAPGVGIELEGTPKNLPDLLGALLAFWEKEMYSVLERTFLTPKEIPIFTGLIHTASHGIGGEALDIPEPEIGERVVFELRARRSLNGDSSQRFESIMTHWLNVLRQQEAQKLKESNAMVGLK